MNKHIISIVSILLLTNLTNNSAFSQDGMIQVEDIYGSSKFYARTIGGFNSMNNDEFYTSTETIEKGKYIIQYSFSTGKAVDTILRPSQLTAHKEPAEFGTYKFSADERKILLSVNSESIYRHSTREEYYLFERDNNKLSKVTNHGKAMYGTFSPDGSMLAYVRDNNLYVWDITSKVEKAITTDGVKNKIINGATDWVYEEEFSMDVAFGWSADGKNISYYQFDESEVKEFNLTTYGELYPKEELYKYPKAGERNSAVSLYNYNLQNNKATLIFKTDSDWEYLPRVKWTQNPDVVSFQRTNRHQSQLELVLYSVSTGKSSVVLKEQNKSFIEITDDLTFLKDGKRFIWTSTRNGYNHIYLYQIDGKLIKQITSGNFDVTQYFGYDEKSSTLFYQSAERSPLERHIYSITISGKKKALTQIAGIHKAEFSSGLKYFADTYSSFDSPYTCTLNQNDGKLLRTLEDNSTVKKTLTQYKLGKIDTLSFSTEDGTRLYGWMITPPDFDKNKKYPVIMHVYGGPGVQTVTNDWDGPNYLWHQMLAQKGYLVVSFDNRGTPGRGLEFANCIYKDMGNLEVQDQLSAVKFLKGKSFVDADRMGVWGWSFGGYMTSLLMTKGNGVFKAGIAVAPVTNWRYYDSIYTERYLQTPQENAKGYDDNSPINYAKDLKGKLLLVHGSTDDNVHMQNSMDFVTALVKANKQFDLFIYPNKNHSIRGGTTRLHLYTMMTNHLVKNL
ncbi:MAG: S9 family peptidase [Bacteroidetes bacterium]|nr:S9 family peptidase [Bacteroidota bacterium]